MRGFSMRWPGCAARTTSPSASGAASSAPAVSASVIRCSTSWTMDAQSRPPPADSLDAMRLHVGCAMWNHAPWQGRYLPSPLAPRERLRAYATWCNAVEGNTTFYATPALDTVRSWAAQTGPDFRFILKLPKPLTHESRLTDTGALRAFLAAIEPLGTRAHTLWIQLPPSFSPGDVGALASFLRLLPRGYRYAVEVRHRAFFLDPHAAEQLERALA